MIYTKQAITLEGQINILKQRGLILDDEDETLLHPEWEENCDEVSVPHEKA